MLTRPSHSQERVWYITVQLIVLADSVRAVAQYANHIYVGGGGGGGGGGKHPRKVMGSGTNCKVPDPFLRKGVARKTRGG